MDAINRTSHKRILYREITSLIGGNIKAGIVAGYAQEWVEVQDTEKRGFTKICFYKLVLLPLTEWTNQFSLYLRDIEWEFGGSVPVLALGRLGGIPELYLRQYDSLR